MTPTQRLNIRLAICRVIDAGGRFEATVVSRPGFEQVWVVRSMYPAGQSPYVLRSSNFNDHLWVCSKIEQIRKEGTAIERQGIQEKQAIRDRFQEAVLRNKAAMVARKILADSRRSAA